MTDEPTDFERITHSMPNHYGEAWSAENTKDNFHLYSHAKRAQTLDVLDDHMRKVDSSNIREFARISKLRRDLAATHATLRKAGR